MAARGYRRNAGLTAAQVGNVESVRLGSNCHGRRPGGWSNRCFVAHSSNTPWHRAHRDGAKVLALVDH